MKILIIGGNRFVGAEVVSRAVLEGHDVTVVALDPPTVRARRHVRFVRANRNSKRELIRGLDGLEFDAVFDNIAFGPDNIRMMFDVLNGRIGRYILTSSVDIYSREVPAISSEEHALLEPSDMKNSPKNEKYLRGKRACEKVLIESSIPWTVIRPAIVFGRTDPVPPAPRNLQGLDKKYGRSLFFPSRVIDGGPILLRKNDRRVFRLANAQDVAKALLLVSHHPDALCRAFNVAGDEIWSSESLVKALCSAAGLSSDIVRVSDEVLESAGLGDYDSSYGRIQWWSVSDNKKLKSLGWKPTPAHIQLSKLIEAALPVDERPFYGRRLQEIALAEKVKRQQRGLIVPRNNFFPLRTDKQRSTEEKITSRLSGALSKEAVEYWQENILGKEATHIQYDSFFRLFKGCPVSSIGAGTHRGGVSSSTDSSYQLALKYAVNGGINVIDTAVNYRWMRAERTVGRALRDLVDQGISREALCICSKGGFVPQDADDPRPLDRYIMEEFVDPGLISMDETIRRTSIKAGFIEKLIDISLENLGLDHIDVYYVHNPERSRARMGLEEFLDDLRKTFIMLEQAVAEGKIGAYGIATWEGLRTSPDNESYLPLEKIYNLALEVGGEEHHFGAIQVPFNVSSNEAYLVPNQEVGGVTMPLFEAAVKLGLYVFTSSSVLQGKTIPADQASRIASASQGLKPIPATLNFTRSTPGVGTSLIGLRRKEYTEEALTVAGNPMLTPEQVSKVFD